MTIDSAEKVALKLFRQHGGVLRTRDALELGIHPRTLYKLRDSAALDQVSRGVYRLASLPDFGEPDLVTVALRVPKAVICLISALAYHEITTAVPHEVQIALPRGTRTPRVEYPPIRVFRFTGEPLGTGIEERSIDGVRVRVYGPEKTVADCFRFRNKLGIDVAIEALNFCIERKRARPAQLLHYARICRVERVMMPFLQARQ